MTKYTARVLALAALLGGCASSVFAQSPAPPVAAPACQGRPRFAAQLCRSPRTCRRPAPARSIYLIAPCFPAQGNAYTVDPQTYLFYMELANGAASRRRTSGCRTTSQPSRSPSPTTSGCGRPASSATSRSKRNDYTFSNGVVGKLITYNMEERERVKIVTYEGIKPIGDRAKVDEQLRARSIELRLDSFLDNGRSAASRPCCAR